MLGAVDGAAHGPREAVESTAMADTEGDNQPPEVAPSGAGEAWGQRREEGLDSSRQCADGKPTASPWMEALGGAFYPIGKAVLVSPVEMPLPWPKTVSLST